MAKKDEKNYPDPSAKDFGIVSSTDFTGISQNGDEDEEIKSLRDFMK